ncbi:nucleotidyltransferase family protein [Mucilaginibacter sp. Bleaf8]|uniref:nucleotidyltransferase family protein n=1 Tax=Mucilaginibacter sp. Bleaf8 TaxID=2834430 RepID=UPI001BCDF4E7|nr:nucleotidyltransferase family protein [Mucilaginibacter sp. Bleaf8]MBS7564272.1 nucleotidyltransferase family protein [Mucilaginibacter sp. Bleaf8]
MTAIIILAAGSSSRMGQPKQQLVYEGSTLLANAVKAAAHSKANQVIVVLGANAEQIQNDIAVEPVQQVLNKDWQQGMASSIHSGIKALQIEGAQVKSAILMLCDQPFVSTDLLSRMITAQVDEKSIIACAYQGTLGAPVLFGNAYFDDLLVLKGQEGAKKLLMKYHQQVTVIPFPEGSIDIDTPEDYRKLQEDDK